jgi:Fe-S-cluster containining protein
LLIKIKKEETMINFECNGCGNCCVSTTPSMTINEFIRLYKNMPSVVLFEFSLVSETSKRKGFEIFNRHGIKYNVVGQTIAIPNRKGCNNLDKDYLCKIYEDRPSVCKLYPINPGITVNELKKSLEIEKFRGREKGGKVEDICEGFTENSPIIFMENKLVDSKTEDLMNSRFEDDKKSSVLLEKMFRKLMLFDYVSDEINNKEKGELLICTEDLLLFLKQEDKITDHQFDEILSVQKELFDEIYKSYEGIEDKILNGNTEFFNATKKIIEYNLEQFE